MIDDPTPKSSLRMWLSHSDLPFVVLCAAALAGGVWIRLQALGEPSFLQLDEHHFVGAARALLDGEPDPNDHPPLGKLLIAALIGVFGDVPVIWRLSSLGFGMGTILLARSFAKRLFDDARAGWLAAVFVAIDGFFVAYSRVALIDGVLVALMLAAGVLALTRRWPLWIAAGFVFGLAASVKLSGAVMMLPFALALGCRAGSWRRWVAVTAASSVAMLAAYWLAGTVAGIVGRVDEPWAYAWTDTHADVLNHWAAVRREHPMTSRWYTWFLPETLVHFSFVLTPGGMIRMQSMLGNVLLWWMSPVAVAVGLAVAVREAWRRARTASGWRAARSALRSPAMRRWGLLLSCWLIPLVPWMLSDRDSYVYHYMPTYAFGVVAVAGWLSKAYARSPAWALVALGAVFAVSAFYAPIWGQFPLGYDGLDLRLFLWR